MDVSELRSRAHILTTKGKRGGAPLEDNEGVAKATPEIRSAEGRSPSREVRTSIVMS